jgi:putative permease
MSEMPPSRPPEQDCPPPSSSAPVVVTQGLTYRDLQRGIFLLAGLFVVWQLVVPLTTLLLFFLLVFILAAVLNPAVVRLQRFGIPRIVGAIMLAVLFLGLLGLIIWLAWQPLSHELLQFIATLDDRQRWLNQQYNNLIQRNPALKDILPAPGSLFQNQSHRLTALLGQVGRYTIGLAVVVLSLFLMIVLVIYTVAHPAPLIAGLLGATPERHRERMETALRRILEQLKNWAVGSLILGIIVGVISWIGLRLLGVPSAFLFGLIAGIGELIPNVGPILSAIPPVLVALTIDPLLALWVVVLFVVIQQLENNVIVPMVMGQSLNLHPISVTFAVLVMGALFGVLGAILAVPVCAIVKVCWEEFYLIPRRTDTEALQVLAEDIVSSDSPLAKDETPLERIVETVTGDQHQGDDRLSK